MNTTRITIALCACGLLSACAEEPEPPSVAQFMEDRILLDATMVRCAQNRASTKYDAECVNAREAVNRISLAEEEARRAKLDAQSERKRRALRRAQEAAAAARRRSQEAERRRREEAYLSQFESNDGESGAMERQTMETAVPPAPGDPAEQPVTDAASDPSAAPTGDPPAAATGTQATDLDAIRQELRRRREDGNH